MNGQFFARLGTFLLCAATLAAQEIHINRSGTTPLIYSLDDVNCLSVTPRVDPVSPDERCPVTESAPTFTWDFAAEGDLSAVTYNLKVVELQEDQDFNEALELNPVVVDATGISETSYDWPAGVVPQETGAYLWRVEAVNNGDVVATGTLTPFAFFLADLPFDARELCCLENLLQNEGLSDGIQAGPLDGVGTLDHWSAAYGSPTVVDDGDGCEDAGYVRISGDAENGDAIQQTLAPGMTMTQGSNYSLTCCARLVLDGLEPADHVVLRAVAFNGSLPGGGAHPGPAADIAWIGASGTITSVEWTKVIFPVWTANKDFDNIAIHAMTADGELLATADIDNVCLQVTNSEPICTPVETDPQGEAIIQPQWQGYLSATTAPRTDEGSQDNGFVHDLYDYIGETTTDLWYENAPDCFTQGGTVPEELETYDLDAELQAMGIPLTAAELGGLLERDEADMPVAVPQVFAPIDVGTALPCDYVRDKDSRFDGRDIIFIHGLDPTQFCDHVSGDVRARETWPASPGQFMDQNGYFRQRARTYWWTHIDTYLNHPNIHNRHMVVAYSCNQGLRAAVHAVLAQIAAAMDTGQNVEPENGNTNCFAREAVIVSHSAGALVADVAMAIAARSAWDPLIQAEFGNVSYIANRMRAHIAFQGAFNGSGLAAATVSVMNSPLVHVAEIISRLVFCETLNFNALAPVINQSILVDLVPAVTQSRWGWLVNSTPVPTLTAAGGHPAGLPVLQHTGLLPGLDDGVLSMDCQCANSNPVWSNPSNFHMTGIPVFDHARLLDMGIETSRSWPYFLDQTINTGWNRAAAGCIAYNSPTGMVQPVTAVSPWPHNPHARYNNHFSFIQSAADHNSGPDFDQRNYKGSSPNGAVNSEEVRAVTDNFAYTSGLVHPDIANLVREERKERWLSVTFHVPIPRARFWPPPPRFWFDWRPVTIRTLVWRRTYHRLQNWQDWNMGDYVYVYTLPN